MAEAIKTPIPQMPAEPEVNTPTETTIKQCIELIQQNRMIDAIKAYRAQTNAGLLAAKNAVEALRDALKEAKAASQTTPAKATLSTTQVIAPKPPHILDIDVTGLHEQSTDILKRLKQGLYPFLHGAPGAGKTTLCQMIAERAKLRFLLLPCSPDMLRSEILGTKNPMTGDYYPSVFFDIWSNGGLSLIDECGNAAGSFLNILNAALANHEITFPNGARVSKHKDCFIVFADNSNLWGTDSKFPERQDAGSAFRNRLFYIHFKYDETLERAIVKKLCPTFGERWHDLVLTIRRIVDKSELGIAASPRFAYAGAKILNDEPIFSREVITEILNGSLWEGLSPDVIGEIRAQVERLY